MHHFASIEGNRLTHASTEGVKKIKKIFPSRVGRKFKK